MISTESKWRKKEQRVTEKEIRVPGKPIKK